MSFLAIGHYLGYVGHLMSESFQIMACDSYYSCYLCWNKLSPFDWVAKETTQTLQGVGKRWGHKMTHHL